MNFSEIVDWPKTESGVYEGVVDDDWFQGRGAFGGVVGAAALRAMEDVVDSERHRVRSLNVQFCGPLVAAPATMHVEVVRRGSSVINIAARIEQGDEVKTTVSGLFARQRDSAIDFDRLDSPDVPSPSEVDTTPYSPLFPSFARYYDYKFCFGEIPYSASDEAAVGGWCRLSDSTEPVDSAQATALLDIWPPAVLTRVDSPTAAATISWQVAFHEPLPLNGASADDFYLVTATSEQAVGGYASERSELWSEDGRRIAEALQLIAVFA